MRKFFLLWFIQIFFLLKGDLLLGYEIMFNGQASVWSVSTHEGQLGVRYIPEISASQKVGEGKNIDADISVNLFSMAHFNSLEEFGENADAKLYRLWLRYSTAQYEMRLGLQKINFGPAKILRSLMWFDRLDVRDPLELTEGVYGLLGRYFFLNNANIWIWGLYGNDELKGLEIFETAEDSLEFGGRYQFPVPRGEMAFSFHHRNIDKEFWKGKMLRSMTNGTENRYAIDGSFDVGVGLWFEGLVGEIKVGARESLWNTFLTLGTDYTFDIGPGIHVLYEHFIESIDSEKSGEDERYALSALSIDFSIGLLDNLSAIAYYDWKQKEAHYYLGWQRAYDNWLINLSVFSSPGDGEDIYSGSGVLFMLAYYH